jgi:hypothetical protein
VNYVKSLLVSVFLLAPQPLLTEAVHHYEIFQQNFYNGLAKVTQTFSPSRWRRNTDTKRFRVRTAILSRYSLDGMIGQLWK